MPQKKKNKRKPKKKAESETQKDNWPRNVGQSLVKTIASSGWVQNLSVTALALATTVICQIMKMSAFKTTVITTCAVLTALIWFIGIRLVRTADSGDLVVNVDTALFCTHFWLRYPGASGNTISPLPVMLAVTLTNTREFPITLDVLSVSGQVRGQPWVTLRHVDTVTGDVYWFINGALTDTALLNLSHNGLDTLLHAALEPHKAVRGVLFFDVTTSFAPQQGEEIRYRWQARDTTGERYDLTTEYTTVRTNQNAPAEAQFSGADLDFKRTHIDLSKLGLTQRRWNETIRVRSNE